MEVNKNNKNLDLLKQEYFYAQDKVIIRDIVEVLEDFEKRITELGEKVKRLEQKDSYYPQCEDEIRENYGGIDDIIIGLDDPN